MRKVTKLVLEILCIHSYVKSSRKRKNFFILMAQKMYNMMYEGRKTYHDTNATQIIPICYNKYIAIHTKYSPTGNKLMLVSNSTNVTLQAIACILIHKPNRNA